jgi:tetratricopeptide (TPR) repeat protein
LEAILRSHDWHFGSKEDDMPEAQRHIAACDFCRDLVSLHLEQGGRLAQLSRPPETPRTPECPDESQWAELAAGLVHDDQAAVLLRHAATCDHCGPLLRQSLEDFAEEVTPAEAEFLAHLQSASPESPESLAARLARATRRPRILDWLRQRLVPRVPVPAWGYVGAAALVAAVVFIVTLPPPVEELLAASYTSQRNLEMRIPDAAYGPLRVVKGAAGVSRLDRPPALLQGEAMIARQLDKSPGDPRWLQARGVAELLDRDYDSAIADFQRCLTLQPASTRLMIELACAHFSRAEGGNSQPDYQTALDFLNRALKITADDPVALFNRAMIYERMGLYNEAMEDWRHYLRVDPNGKWADEARKRLAEVDQSGASVEALRKARERTERLTELAEAEKRLVTAQHAGAVASSQNSFSNPTSQSALLVVQGALPRTSVSVGARQLGITDPRGEIHTGMQPGTYAVTLSKDGYRPRNVNVTLSNGLSTLILPPQSRLDLITGTITLKKEPTRMRLTILQTSGSPMESPSVYDEAPDQLILPVGHYILIFEAPGYKTDTEGPIGLTDGQNINVPVKLGR